VIAGVETVRTSGTIDGGWIERSLLGELPDALVHPGERALQNLGVDVDEIDAVPGLGDGLGDPGPHRPAADNGKLLPVQVPLLPSDALDAESDRVPAAETDGGEPARFPPVLQG
jgi:hypothetical protein